MIFENASLFFKKLKKILLCPCFPFPDLITAEFPRCRISFFRKSSRRGPLFPRGNMCRRHAGKAARMKSGGTRVKQQYAHRQSSGTHAKRRPQRAARNSGGPGCPCAPPSDFVRRCSARGSPSRAVPFGRFGKGAPPGYALSVCAARHVCRTAACGISFPCLQFSARIFSSSSCR